MIKIQSADYADFHRLFSICVNLRNLWIMIFDFAQTIDSPFAPLYSFKQVAINFPTIPR